MYYELEIKTPEFAFEHWDMPEFDAVGIEFNDDQMHIIQGISEVVGMSSSVRSAILTFEPDNLSPLLNGAVVLDYESTDWDRLFCYCDVSIDSNHHINITWFNENEEKCAWVDPITISSE